LVEKYMSEETWTKELSFLRFISYLEPTIYLARKKDYGAGY
jgi:hypothetical protein